MDRESKGIILFCKKNMYNVFMDKLQHTWMVPNTKRKIVKKEIGLQHTKEIFHVKDKIFCLKIHSYFILTLPLLSPVLSFSRVKLFKVLFLDWYEWNSTRRKESFLELFYIEKWRGKDCPPPFRLFLWSCICLQCYFFFSFNLRIALRIV